jgi:ATP-dependent Clp protease ATP-binding subunit ClpA
VLERFDKDARRAVMLAAKDEAKRRGDRRIGTDHLLLGLLHDPESVAVRTLGVDLTSARAASEALDRAALAAIGIDLGDRSLATPVQAARHAPLTSGARTVLQLSLDQARQGRSRRIQARHLLLALLARQRPDPAAELLHALGVDPSAARDRLAESGN